MQVKIDVSESDVMKCDEVMKEIAEAQGWTITLEPGYGTGEESRIVTSEEFRIVTNDGKNREGTYFVASDEIKWDDGEVGSLFADYDGNKDYTGESLMQFLDVCTAIWGTTGDTEDDEELVLYIE